jgi:hypothetical protein
MSGLRIAAIIFGIGFIVVGILGFFPAFAPNGHLLGLFMVDTFHNWVHILSGVVALLAAFADRFVKLYFQVFGIVYLIVALAGFFLGGNLWLMHVTCIYCSRSSLFWLCFQIQKEFNPALNMYSSFHL